MSSKIGTLHRAYVYVIEIFETIISQMKYKFNKFRKSGGAKYIAGPPYV